MSTPPILEPRGREAGIIDPIRLYRKKRRIPSRVVLCFFWELLRDAARRGELTLRHRLRGEGEPVPVYTAGRGRHAVTVAWPGVSAPFAASILEELVGLGGRQFLCCGSAGVLDGRIPVGMPIVITKALRDEGTSYHYQRPGRWSHPDRGATAALKEACRRAKLRYRVGASWTTDGVYRETPKLIRERRAEGCLAVEMEAAAFFAVARYRQVPFGQILYAGDDVSGERWSHRDWLGQRQAREVLFRLTLDAARHLDRSSAEPTKVR